MLSGIAIAAILTVGLLVAATRIPFSSNTLRHRVIETLAARLESDVELDTLTLRLAPVMQASGAGLRIHHKGRRDVPPLISVESFVVTGRLTGLWHRRVDTVLEFPGFSGQ